MRAYDSQTTNTPQSGTNGTPHGPATSTAGQPLPAADTFNSLQQLFDQAHLTSDLAAIQSLLLERAASQSTPIAASGAHIIRSGGKHLRAALVLLAARLGTYDFAQVRHAAAAVELIHTASLVHDDLVDGTERRRGSATIHTRWDNDVALMLGDYFFALAAAEMAMCADSRVITFYAHAVQTIVEGELRPVTAVAPFDAALERYLYKTGAKTASLFEAGCKAGAALSGGSDATIEALGHYGYALGLAFQIIDDMLDFTGSESLLGKPPGNDLRQGTITLPLICAAAGSSNPLLQRTSDAPPPTEAEVARIIEEVIRAEGISQASAYADMYTRQAIARLEALPASPARHALIHLTRSIQTRQT
jgi:heptaprenyl diphosphate synthase/octaprenyl-diphosphate synthase